MITCFSITIAKRIHIYCDKMKSLILKFNFIVCSIEESKDIVGTSYDDHIYANLCNWMNPFRVR